LEDGRGLDVTHGVDDAAIFFSHPAAEFIELTFRFVQASEFVPVDDDLVGI